MIIKDRNFNITDISGKEIQEEGTQLFNIVATDEDIQNYAFKQIEPHWHDMFELVLIESGKAIVNVGKQSHQLNNGDACFISPNSLHSVITIGKNPCRFHSFVIAKTVLTGATGSIYDMRLSQMLDNMPPFIAINHNTENKLFYDNFVLAWKAMETEEAYYEFTVREAITKIMLFLDKKNKPNNSNNVVNDERFKKALTYIDEHIYENLSVEEIAKSIYLGKRETQRLFLTYLHISPMAYVRQKKVSMSCNDLYNDTINIAEIAYKYGFSSPGHYTKVFKEIMEVKPLEYRKKCKH